jgi:hypothetical protein
LIEVCDDQPNGFGAQKNDPQNHPSDDEDHYQVDNIAIMFPNAVPDFEAQAVKIV